MFVINPDPYLIPAYRISPFKTDNISFNHRLPNDNIIDEYFCQRFNGNKFIYTVNGRSALQLALMQYNLQKEDIVTIFTTSGNNYISKCVTNEIEKICKWSRSIEVNTRIIIVNHEFGYPYKELEELKRYRLPIIEDCAFSFFSIDKKSIIGSIGDFTIFSFPKIFPIQIGGLLVLNTNFQYPV
jgi:dTDP-4-amino-4,6-dideoxygalactose transaminase